LSAADVCPKQKYYGAATFIFPKTQNLKNLSDSEKTKSSIFSIKNKASSDLDETLDDSLEEADEFSELVDEKKPEYDILEDPANWKELNMDVVTLEETDKYEEVFQNMPFGEDEKFDEELVGMTNVGVESNENEEEETIEEKEEEKETNPEAEDEQNHPFKFFAAKSEVDMSEFGFVDDEELEPKDDDYFEQPEAENLMPNTIYENDNEQFIEQEEEKLENLEGGEENDDGDEVDDYLEEFDHKIQFGEEGEEEKKKEELEKEEENADKEHIKNFKLPFEVEDDYIEKWNEMQHGAHQTPEELWKEVKDSTDEVKTAKQKEEERAAWGLTDYVQMDEEDDEDDKPSGEEIILNEYSSSKEMDYDGENAEGAFDEEEDFENYDDYLL
jgi:hypothetical protein